MTELGLPVSSQSDESSSVSISGVVALVDGSDLDDTELLSRFANVLVGCDAVSRASFLGMGIVDSSSDLESRRGPNKTLGL